jgi:hypothetical protein
MLLKILNGTIFTFFYNLIHGFLISCFIALKFFIYSFLNRHFFIAGPCFDIFGVKSFKESKNGPFLRYTMLISIWVFNFTFETSAVLFPNLLFLFQIVLFTTIIIRADVTNRFFTFKGRYLKFRRTVVYTCSRRCTEKVRGYVIIYVRIGI